jgi:hypothetical protein
LKIADEYGEIEEELSALDGSNLVGRFGFNDLALIENESNVHETVKRKDSNNAINVFM